MLLLVQEQLTPSYSFDPFYYHSIRGRHDRFHSPQTELTFLFGDIDADLLPIKRGRRSLEDEALQLILDWQRPAVSPVECLSCLVLYSGCLMN